METKVKENVKVDGLGLNADDFTEKEKEISAVSAPKKSYLHYETDGKELERLFSFFLVKMTKTKAGRLSEKPLQDKMDRWLNGFLSSGYDAVKVIQVLKSITEKPVAKK